MRVSSRASRSLINTLKIIKKKFGDEGKIIMIGSLINVLTNVQRQKLEELELIDEIIPIDPNMGWKIEKIFPELKDRRLIESNEKELTVPSQLMVIPDFSRMKCEEYINFRAGTRIFPFRTSIGCKFECAYCIDYQVWGQYKEYPIYNIECYLTKFIKKYKPDVVRFLDLLLNVNPKRLKALSEVLQKINKETNKEKEFFWVGMATADILLSFQLATQLYDSGCRYLWLGLESGSPRIRKLMRKKISPDMSLTLENLKKAGISTLIYLIPNFRSHWSSKIEISDSLTKTFLLSDALFRDQI